jgi:predicted nucleic acid-binding protein
MSRAERRLNRAIKIMPPRDRDRYVGEWRCDLSSAAEVGISPAEVARGATRVAWSLRRRAWAQNLSGAEGARRATVAWAWVVALLLVLLVFGSWLSLLSIPASMVVAVRLARHGHSRPTDAVMLATLVLWLVCTVVYWWLWGVGFDAADAGLPMPAVMKWYKPSFLMGFGAFIIFWAAFAVSATRQKSWQARLNGPGSGD